MSCAKWLTDPDAVWDLDLGGPKEAYIRWDAHWHNLVNATEPSMCGVDAACCQIILYLFLSSDRRNLLPVS